MSDTQEQPKSITDYLAALAWDGVPRIDRWLIDCAGADDTPYVRSASRAMLVAAVRRARNPGCRFDSMPVLDGPQGSGKSAALRVLAVHDAWFSDSIPLLDADVRRIIEATAGRWIVEACELESLLQRAVVDDEDEDDEDDDDDDDEDEDELPPAAALKSFLSRTVDEARMPYQRERTRVPRQFVVVGTTAAPPYLTDAAGNRRIWPIHVRRFDLARLTEVRDQLWAEAAIAEATGEQIDLAGMPAAA